MERATTAPDAGRISQDDVDVGLRQFVDADGEYDPETIPDLDPAAFRDLYRWMVVERVFDDRMVSLQRRGDLGTYGSGRGQEASIVGSAYALADQDWLLGMGREAAAMFVQGLSMRDLILFWRGVEDAGEYMAREGMMIAISIGSHLPLVTGMAWGMDLRDDDAVAAAYFGDGATSTGAVHEALNFAGVLEAPTLFFCQNNQYAISTPFEKQTRARSVAQRAIGYGIEGIRVDGNDVLAVHDAVAEARRLARDGRPTLVESVTYRRGAHTTSDDPGRYRDEDEREEWAGRDPLDRYEAFLRAEGLWEEIDEEGIRDDVEAEFDEALAAADAYEQRDVDEIFAHVYDEMPPALQRQLDEFRTFLADHPEAREYVEQRPKG